MKKNILLSVGLFLFTGMILHAQQNKPGLYAGDVFQGEMDLYDSLDWIVANAQDGGDYSVVLGDSITASSSVLDCKGKTVTISLKSSGKDLQVSYTTRSPSSSLFTIKEGVTFVLENGVELVGRTSASRPPITVDGGNFIMNGGAIKDSKVDDISWFGGGVDLLHGTFTMNNGIISGNACAGGAGVNICENTSFIMNGGTIKGNTTIGFGTGTGFGGGVIVCGNATFTMNGGVIDGNSADYGNGYGGGGGIYVSGTFIMNNGAIINNRCYNDSNIMYGEVIACGTGGGVCVSGSGTFVMHGGLISTNSNHGVYLTNNIMSKYVHGTGNGKIIMNGGSILFNNGSGVSMYGTFEMNGGIIKGNHNSSGAGVYVSSGTFTMNNGEIIENTAIGSSSTYTQGGGGVLVKDTFIMNGGIIAKNIANGESAGGGGVLVDGTFTMNGGTISGNSTTKSGGGVLVSGGSFTKSNTAGVIYGGDATEDKRNQSDVYGHAVYTQNGSRDSTARATMELDSTKQGVTGGWE